MKAYIYKITNPNGLIYIGRTKNPKKRFRTYEILNCKEQPALYNSLKKYGYDKHIIEIIDECELDEAPKKEEYYIEKLNSFHNGLNCTFGGFDGFLPGEFSCSKREDVRKKMSERKIEYYKHHKHPSLGAKRSQETIDKIKERRAVQAPIIRYYVLDLETGIYYEGIKELSNILGINYKAFHHRIRKNRYINKYLIC